jgi:hypothetical protein
MVLIVSQSAIGTPSLSETSCNARVASELETKASGFPKSKDCQNALGSGMGDGAWPAAIQHVSARWPLAQRY